MFFDPLVAKLVVCGETRAQTVERLREALAETKVYGPPNNVAYLRAICEAERIARQLLFAATPRLSPSPS